jgi:hypothetical protein
MIPIYRAAGLADIVHQKQMDARTLVKTVAILSIISLQIAR